MTAWGEDLCGDGPLSSGPWHAIIRRCLLFLGLGPVGREVQAGVGAFGLIIDN
jgi:hypothetical protein